MPKRDQHVARGVRLLFSSRGVGKRVDLYACVLQLFVALALLPVREARRQGCVWGARARAPRAPSQVAKMLADTIMQYLFAERRHYREYKAETTPDFSDVRAKVEQLEKQSQSEQEKLRAYA